MTLIFTICSVNYLAQAKTLGESLMKHNPDFQFVIGLVDKLNGIEILPEYLPTYKILEVEHIGIENFQWMCDHYDITELNTAVKPSFIQYFFKQFPKVQHVIYLDPDIIVFQPLTHLLNNLKKHDIIITPHICSPLEDEFHPSEQTHLNTGLYNLGFIALHRSENTLQFVRWWQEKLAYECKIDLCNGLFVDQNWVNFAPYYFDNVLTEKNLGYNVAYWNLHERHLNQTNGEWRVNKDYPLQFFHYSGYQLHKSEVLSKYQNRFTFEQRPDVVPLFQMYAKRLEINGNAYFSSFRCSYIKPSKVIRYRRVRKVLRYPFATLANWIEKM